MLTANFQRIYFYHLKKTGGSSFKQWLDTLTFDDRTCKAKWIGSWLMERKHSDQNVAQTDHDTALLQRVFRWSDVIHSHTPLRRYAPEGTFCLTILRDPVQRLLSQIADWRRHNPTTTNRMSAPFRDMITDTNELTLRDHLEYHGRNNGSWMLDNFMTRALAAGRIGREALLRRNADTLLDVALSVLENDYDLIGLTEESRSVAECSLRPGRIAPGPRVSHH